MPTAFRTALNPSAGGLDSPPTSGYALWLDGRDTATLFTDAGVTAITTNGQSVYQWNDKSGSSRNATQATSASRPTWVDSTSGRNGYGAVSFNGSQWLDCSDYSSLNFGTGDFSIEGWMNPTSFSGNTVLIGCGNNGFALYFTSSGQFSVTHYGVAGLIISSAVSTSTWTHFAVTRSGTTMRVFLNGTVASTLTGNSSNFTGTNATRIGGDPSPGNGNNKYVGKLQNLLIYKGQAIYTANFTPWMS